MQFTELHEIIEERSKIDNDWEWGVEKPWEKMTDVFSVDIEKMILFLDECSTDEFSWIREIFRDM